MKQRGGCCSDHGRLSPGDVCSIPEIRKKSALFPIILQQALLLPQVLAIHRDWCGVVSLGTTYLYFTLVGETSRKRREVGFPGSAGLNLAIQNLACAFRKGIEV